MSEVKFDQALKDLEKLVEEMEEEEVSLEESLKKYEKGMELIRICLEKLDRAEKRIEILKKPTGTEPETEPYTDYSQSLPGEKRAGEELSLE